MGNVLKDLAVLLFSAGDEIEKKAEEYRRRREERYSEFEKQISEKKDDLKSRIDDELARARHGLNELTGKLGVATKNDVDELRKKIEELSVKLDSLVK